MKKLKAQTDFVEALFINFRLSMNEHIKENETPKSLYGGSATYMNPNFGKTALKRKITLIRRELLNLEKMIERI